MGERRYMRHLLVTSGRIDHQWRQPLEEVSVIDPDTGEPNGSATDLPTQNGVIEHREDGTETLATVDGLRLDLDGQGRNPGERIQRMDRHFHGDRARAPSKHRGPRARR